MKFRLSRCPLCGDRAESAEPYRLNADIVRCPSCDLVYLRTRGNRSTTTHYYQDYASRPGSHMRLPVNEEEANTSGLRRDYFMALLLKHTKPEGKLIDVGGGWGAFAKNAKDKGFDPIVVELCAQAADYCRDTLGIPAYAQDIEDLPFDEKSAQVVVSIHALEHLQNPDAALAAIRRITVPGGILAGIVPNIDSSASQIMAEKWIWLDPDNHLTYFSPTTLRRHLEQRGFGLIEMYTQTGDFGPENVRTAVNKASDRAVPDEELGPIIEDANKSGYGEEIVFVFRRI